MRLLVIKKETKDNLTTTFLNGKMLTFSKTIQSFVYNLVNVFVSPDNVDKEIYKKKWNSKMFFAAKSNRNRCHFSVLIFICKLSCSINEKTARNIIFEVLTKSKVLNRLDLSNHFREQFILKTRVSKSKVVCMK